MKVTGLLSCEVASRTIDPKNGIAGNRENQPPRPQHLANPETLRDPETPQPCTSASQQLSHHLHRLHAAADVELIARLDNRFGRGSKKKSSAPDRQR